MQQVPVLVTMAVLDHQLSHHYSPRIKEKRELGEIHRQILLNFVFFAQNNRPELFS